MLRQTSVTNLRCQLISLKHILLSNMAFCIQQPEQAVHQATNNTQKQSFTTKQKKMLFTSYIHLHKTVFRRKLVALSAAPSYTEKQSPNIYVIEWPMLLHTALCLICVYCCKQPYNNGCYCLSVGCV